MATVFLRQSYEYLRQRSTGIVDLLEYSGGIAESSEDVSSIPLASSYH